MFHCNICNMSVNSEDQLNQHFAGSKHKGRAAGNLQNPRNRADDIKAAGMNYFVKEGNPTGQNQHMFVSSTTTENAGGSTPQEDTNVYCSTCRITMRSQAQAEMHYNGAKHKNKLKMLEAMKGNNTAQAPLGNPDYFCETCRVQLTSASQAQMHYAGSKHQSKLKQMDGAGTPFCVQLTGIQPLQEFGKMPGNSQIFQDAVKLSTFNVAEHSEAPTGGNSVPDNFCYVCRMQLTSVTQAQMHFTGTKHKSKLKLIEETKTQSNPPTEGEPSAKKSKFVEMCKTCNVVLTCADMASAHYTGSKHAKKIRLLKQLEQVPFPSANSSNSNAAQPNEPVRVVGVAGGVGVSRPIQKGEDGAVNKGGHLYCSFCDIHMNSEIQMDAHRSGSKHKTRVHEIAHSKPEGYQNVVQQTMVTSFSVAPGNQGPLLHKPVSRMAPPPPPPQPPQPQSLPTAGGYPYLMPNIRQEGMSSSFSQYQMY